MMERVAGEMDTDEAADLLERAVEPMRDLVAALRAKLLIVGAAGTPRRPAALSDITIRAARRRATTTTCSRCTRRSWRRAERSRASRRPTRRRSARAGSTARPACTSPSIDGALAGSYHLLPNYDGHRRRTSRTPDTWWRRHFRRRGVGRALVEHSLDEARRRRVRRDDVQPRARVEPEPPPVRASSASRRSAACPRRSAARTRSSTGASSTLHAEPIIDSSVNSTEEISARSSRTAQLDRDKDRNLAVAGRWCATLRRTAPSWSCCPRSSTCSARRSSCAPAPSRCDGPTLARGPASWRASSASGSSPAASSSASRATTSCATRRR